MPKHTLVTDPGPPQELATPVDGGRVEPAAGDVLAIADRLRPVLLRLNRSLRGEAHELGVTSTQVSLLIAIHHDPGIGLSDLAARERISGPTVVSHIDNLESAGLVERARSDPNDRRRVDLRLTEAGMQVLQTLRARRTAWLADRLAKLSPAALAAIEVAIEPLQEIMLSSEESK